MTLSLLLYIHVPVLVINRANYIEAQACNGIKLWAESFEKVTILLPLDEGPLRQGYVPLRLPEAAADRITLRPLPMAYRPDRFLRALRSARRTIRREIAAHDLCCFAIGGLFGDWGSVACLEAYRLGKPYAVWTDRVESEVVRRSADQGPLRRRLMARLTHQPMAWMERAVIRRAALGLFHGRDTFEAYAPYCRQPELVHNIHIRSEDHIDDAEMERKLQRSQHGPLRIGYAGRAEAMKGPEDWVGVLAALKRRGIPFTGVWFGEGAALESMRAQIAAQGLSEIVQLPGLIADRASMLAALRELDIFLFCHKTPESPRVLIEALTSGCALVGYETAYPRDLTATHGGGLFTPLGDVAALAEQVAALNGDRQRLQTVMRAAREDGRPFDDVSVFRHRSDLIKRYLHLPGQSDALLDETR